MADIKYNLSVSAQKAIKTLKDTKKQLDTTNKSAVSAGKAFTALKAAITGAAVAMGVNFVRNNLAAAATLSQTASKVGFTVEALQELRFAAEQNGIATQTLDMALQRFSRRVGEAAAGTGELKKPLEELGISLRDNQGNLRNTDDVLMDFLGAIDRTASSSDKLRLAFKGFDAEGAALVNVLRNGIGGLEGFRAKARELGVVLDENLVKQAEVADDAFNRVKQQLLSLGIVIVSELAPALNELALDMQNFLADPENIKAVADAMRNLGGAVRMAAEAMLVLVENMKPIAIAFAALKITQMVAKFESVAAAIGAVTAGIKALQTSLVVLGRRLVVFTTAAAVIWGVVEALKALSGESKEAVETLKMSEVVREIKEVQAEIKRLQDVADDPFAQGVSEDLDVLFKRLEELKQRRAELEKQATVKVDIDPNKTTTAVATVTESISETEKALQALRGELDPTVKLLDDYNKKYRIVIESFDAGEITPTEFNELIKQLEENYINALNALEGFDEETDKTVSKAKTFSEAWSDAFKEYKDAAFNAAENAKTIFNSVSQSMEDAIFNFAKTGKMNFKSFAQSVIDDMLRIQSKQLASKIMGGNMFSGIGKLFSGFFATGGTIPAGRYGIAGESGPEIVTGPAEVTPMTGGNITYNINAVDAPSFQALIAQDPQFIFAVTEQGRQSLPRFT